MRNKHLRSTQRSSQRAEHSSTSALVELLESARFEVLPTAGTADLVAEALPAGRTVTVTASPARGLQATLTLTEQLAARGFRAVPHLAARMISGPTELNEIVARLRATGVDRIFVPSGDAPQVGEYPDAFSVLHALDELGRPFTHVGITAYPESHPTISDDLTIQAMWDKREHATEMVSNMTFDPRVVRTWLERVRGRGVTLPLWLGLPAPVGTAQLMGVATRIGVGESTRFLTKHPRTVLRLLRPDGFSSDTFLRHLAPTLARADAHVAGLHVFTFNQVGVAESWRTALLDRLHGERGPSP